MLEILRVFQSVLSSLLFLSDEASYMIFQILSAVGMNIIIFPDSYAV
jgi:hypothetical protein